MITLTVIIRDEGPVRHLNEPVAYRTVQIALTHEQERQVQFRHPHEAISHCFLEPTGACPCGAREARR